MTPETRSRISRNLARTSREADTLLLRVGHEIEFAKAFSEALDRKEWESLGEQADSLLEALDQNSGFEDLQRAVHEVENLLEPIGRAAKEYTIHNVGHGHIDMNWMWSWPETAATTHDTFASVLSFMETFPDFTFSQSQASVYALTEKYYPQLFEQIQKRVKEGRWEVTAVHWVEGDKNLASGESLARHLLYTRRYFQEKFGLTPEDVTVDWEPDTFGHANTIPTILAQAGVKHYYSCRPGGGHGHDRTGDERPPVFWWQGPDGSRILVYKEITWYNSYETPTYNVGMPLSKFVRATGLKDWLNVYGVGNHGGGPTRAEIEFYSEAASWPIYPQLRFSTSREFFQRTESAAQSMDIPVFDYELNYEFTGCFTSQSAIKKANRLGENYCVEAETLALLESRLGGSAVPADRLRDAWVNVLFNQFHDILPGSGVAATRAHALGLFQEVGAITGAIKRTAAVTLGRDLDTASLLPDAPEAQEELADLENDIFVAGSGQGSGESGLSYSSGGGRRYLPFVVYNPCAWSRSEPVTVHLYDSGFDPKRIVARDEQGRNHPTLFLKKERDWGHDRIDVMFNATDIPSLGFRTFLFCEGDVTPGFETVEVNGYGVVAGDQAFRFDRTYAGFLPATAEEIRSHGQKRQDITAGPGMGVWIKTHEAPNGMTAWVLGDEDEPLNVLTADTSCRWDLWLAGWQTDPQSIFRLEHKLLVPESDSSVKVATTVSPLAPRVDFEAHVDWREIGSNEKGIPGLAVAFPSSFPPNTVWCESPFGHVDRSDYEGEVPSLRYVHLGTEAGSGYEGFTLLQDSKYGFKLESGVLMRVVRSSYDPDHAPEVAKSSLRYSVVFHKEWPTASDLTRLGAAWNHPLMVFPALLQRGSRPTTRAFVEVKTSNVVLTCIKAAEQGNGVLLRLVEHDGVDTEAVVELSPELANGLSTAQIVDLMERPSGRAASLSGTTLKIPVSKHSFVSVLLS